MDAHAQAIIFGPGLTLMLDHYVIDDIAMMKMPRQRRALDQLSRTDSRCDARVGSPCSPPRYSEVTSRFYALKVTGEDAPRGARFLAIYFRHGTPRWAQHRRGAAATLYRFTEQRLQAFTAGQGAGDTLLLRTAE